MNKKLVGFLMILLIICSIIVIYPTFNIVLLLYPIIKGGTSTVIQKSIFVMLIVGILSVVISMFSFLKYGFQKLFEK